LEDSDGPKLADEVLAAVATLSDDRGRPARKAA
jgi:hypothetical protein